MKFLFITDTHATAKGPSSRTDSYMGAVREKLLEVADVIKQEGVTAVIHGGDLFDKPVVSLQLTGEIGNIIKSTGVPWYVVPGNHDLFGYNISSLPQTSLGLLERTGVITVLDRKHGPVEFIDYNGSSISFEGQEYHQDIDHQDPAKDYYTLSQSDYKVLIPHSMLLDKEYFPDIPYTNTKDLKDRTAADAILVGHYHDGYKAHAIQHSNGNHTLVYNPGSMLRDEASKGNLTRVPQYLIVDTSSIAATGEPILASYPFQSAKPGVDIFDRSHITTKQTKNRYLQNFEAKLNQSAMNAVDVRSVLHQIIAKDPSIDAEIGKEANNRLTASEQAIDDVSKQMTGYIEKPANIQITEIHIKGFQSHEDTSIQLSGGLNAIIGPSDSGKSAIIRALRFALYNEPKGSEFIRQGAKEANVTVCFSDGSKLRRARSEKSAGVYEITSTAGTLQSLKGFTNNIPVDVPNTHQMPYIQLAKDMEMTLNIGYQLDVPFLIGESPGTRAAVIGHLTGVNLVDGAVRDLGRDILANSKEIKILDGQIQEIDTKMNTFNDLDEMGDKIEKANQILSKMELHEKMKHEFESMNLDIKSILSEEEDIRLQAREILPVLKIVPEVDKLVALHQDLNIYRDINKQYQETTLLENSLQASLAMSKQTADTLIPISTLEESVRLRDEYLSLQKDIVKVMDEEVRIQTELSTISDVSLTQIEGVQSVAESLRLYEQLRDDVKANRMEAIELRKQLKLVQQAEALAAEEYQQILENAGVCPTCSQPVRSHVHA